MSNTLLLTEQLIACASVTPHDAGCQAIIAERLQTLGFTVEHLRFGEVPNLWARRGTSAPLFVFAGHTDVVPPGALDSWTSPPFTPTLRDGYLYGRGSADMKGNLAAMLTACAEFIDQYPEHSGSIAFLITGDEEGPATHGTQKVLEHLYARGEKIDWCVIGEPSSQTVLGDTIKNGRRGSLSGCLHIEGKQGHIAYPQLADNPIHRALPALSALTHAHWDKGNTFFPPTTFQISNIHAGTGTGNVIPGEIVIDFNFRYSTETSAEQLQISVNDILQKYGLRYHIDWQHSGLPFITEPGVLVDAVCQAIRDITLQEAVLSTSGGTSDGRFIAPYGIEVIELGVCNASIHQVDECVKVKDLDTLSSIYRQLLASLLNS